MSQYIQNLTEAVTALHGCDCAHLGSHRIVEFYEGQMVFNGDVERFAIFHHPTAQEAYAWAWDNGTEPQYIAVLKVPPINDPGDAVRAAIASGAFK